MRARRHPEEERLVGDLLARLERYRIESVMCARCRAWGTRDEVATEGWHHFGDELYCPACSREEFELRQS